MRVRKCSIGCQPNEELCRSEDDLSGKYYYIIFCCRKLSREEMDEYELDFIREEDPHGKLVKRFSCIY